MINTINEDELDYYFSKIDAKGMCLIFDSCLRGGIASKFNTLQCEFEKGLEDDLIRGRCSKCDVDGSNRIVITSTLPDCVMVIYSMTGYLFGTPLIDEDYPRLSATKYVLFYILLIRLGTHLITGYPMGNWPNMRDDYHGELPIVKI